MIKNRLLFRVITLDIISSFLDNIFYTVIIISLSQSNKSTTLLPLMTMLMFLPTFLSVLFGAIADNTKQRIKYIILSNVIRIILFMSIAYLTSDVINTNILLFVVFIYVVINLFGAFENSLYIPVIPSLVRSEDLPIIFSQTSALQSGVNVIAPIMGAICLQIVTFSELATIVSVIEIVIVICLYQLKSLISKKLNLYYISNGVDKQIDKSNNKPKRINILKNFIKSSNDILKFKLLRMPLIFILLYNGLASSIILIIPLLVSKHVNFRLINLSYTISILNALSGGIIFIGGFFLAKYLTKIKFKYINIIAYTSWISIFISALIVNIYIFTLSIMIMALLSAILAAQLKTIIINNMDKNLLSSYIGFLNSLLGFSPIIFTCILSVIVYFWGDITMVIKFYLLPMTFLIWIFSVRYVFRG